VIENVDPSPIWQVHADSFPHSTARVVTPKLVRREVQVGYCRPSAIQYSTTFAIHQCIDSHHSVSSAV